MRGWRSWRYDGRAGSAKSQEERWRRAAELPPDVFAVLHKADRAINPITVVATVDADGAPRTAPFGSLRAVTPSLLRLACNQYHDTYANLCRDGRVSVALLAPPNIAVSILGGPGWSANGWTPATILPSWR